MSSGTISMSHGNSKRPSLIPVKVKDQSKLPVFTQSPSQRSLDRKKDDKYRFIRKTSAPNEQRNYVSQSESSLPLSMALSPLDPVSYYPKERSERTGLLDKYKCGICSNILSDSRVLNCLHIFCLECLYSIDINQTKITPRNLATNLSLDSFECIYMSSSNCSDESRDYERKQLKSIESSTSRISIRKATKKRPDEPKKVS